MTTAELDLADTAEHPDFREGTDRALRPDRHPGEQYRRPGLWRRGGTPDRRLALRAFQDMVLSVIALTDALLPGMRARRWGRILTVISSGVIQPIPILGDFQQPARFAGELVEDAVGRDRRRRRHGEHPGARAASTPSACA